MYLYNNNVDSSAALEIGFILKSVWMHYFYYFFAFSFIVLILLLIISSEISILVSYFGFLRYLLYGDYIYIY